MDVVFVVVARVVLVGVVVVGVAFTNTFTTTTTTTLACSPCTATRDGIATQALLKCLLLSGDGQDRCQALPCESEGQGQRVSTVSGIIPCQCGTRTLGSNKTFVEACRVEHSLRQVVRTKFDPARLWKLPGSKIVLNHLYLACLLLKHA